MNDKELTTLAYKAAFCGAELGSDKDMQKRWHPLTDDGDALRLAVKLKIDTKHYPDYVVCWHEDFFGTGKIFYNDNPCAATRRAIVRAAAEIGKSTP